MKSFIEHIIDDIPGENLDALKAQVYVFPSRRACFHFREALLKTYPDRTFWMPDILSIEDFIVKCTNGVISSEKSILLFALYQSYRDTYLPSPSGEVDKEDLPTFDKFLCMGTNPVERFLMKWIDI